MNALRNAIGGSKKGKPTTNDGMNKGFSQTKTTSRVTKVANPPAIASSGGWTKPLAPVLSSKPSTAGSSPTNTASTNRKQTVNGTTTSTIHKKQSPSTSTSTATSIPVSTNEKPSKPSGSATEKALTPFSSTPNPPLSSLKRATSRRTNIISASPSIPPAEKAKNLYAQAPSSKWKFSQHTFDGISSYDSIGKQETIDGKSIQKAVQTFKTNPAKYIAIMYQTDMETWPTEQQSYIWIHREGTMRFQPQGTSPKGWMTILLQEYQHLTAFPNNELPLDSRDKYTDDMVHHNRTIHTKYNPPILPGRGMGVGDTPLLKIIGNVDPADIHQGQVGDCWLLSAISALAEFDGAIKKLFRKTKDLDRMPLDRPNTYIVTLWDLPTWKEVDIVIDERLASLPDGSGKLLAARPSEDGELWVCYLEKALAVHCGGWDKITGGQCSHAWSLMTGCRAQYTIRKNPQTGKFACYAKYNPNTGKWTKHVNCPHDNRDMWRVAWPKVGGGGGTKLELNEDELFEKMYAFDVENFIVAAGTNGTSDKNKTDGMVDNHAYSVIEAVRKAAGTNIDLFKVRNPWGKGEIENGEFDDDGPGWKQYPEIKKMLNPVVADDGIFWMKKQEFFRLFDHIYVSASNMTHFLED